MDDLISRKALLEVLEDYGFNQDTMIPTISLMKVLEIIEEQPTAYDVDKVIEKLEQVLRHLSSLKENAKLKSENSKLKAEIEQLELSCDSIETSSIKYYNLYKEALEQIARLKEQVEVKDNNFELYCDLVDENERLYAELGKLGWNR